MYANEIHGVHPIWGGGYKKYACLENFQKVRAQARKEYGSTVAPAPTPAAAMSGTCVPADTL